MTRERRVFRRTRVLRDVEVRPVASGKPDPEQKRQHGRMVDIGCGGMLALVDEPLDVGTRCSVQIESESPTLGPQQARGDVRSSRPADDGSLVGIAFDQPMLALSAVASSKLAIETPKPESKPAPLVLVVDDEHHVRRMLDRFVSQRGYRVQTAADAIEALELMRKELPQLMLLDIRLPGVSGLQLLELMRSEGLRVGAIWAISGYVSDGDAMTALKLGATDFINKPFDLDHLDWSLRLHEPIL